MEECKWNFKILSHYIRLTKLNVFKIIGKKEGQWIDKVNINLNNGIQ